ncbi:MAG: NUDIX domain-containing protein [Anaerolineae bacterium]|nr:NUDIX domain-containing protein [Anaerolineae bacterium]
MGASEQGLDHRRWKAIPRTLCFIRNGDALLLMKRGPDRRAFPGRYNGVGGHIERGEDPLSAARREIEEETGLRADQLYDVRLRGVCHIDAGGPAGILLFVFSAEATTRDVHGDDREGTLHWIAPAALADLPLVDDVPVYVPRLFGPHADDRVFFAHMGYDDQGRMALHFAESTV